LGRRSVQCPIRALTAAPRPGFLEHQQHAAQHQQQAQQQQQRPAERGVKRGADQLSDHGGLPSGPPHLEAVALKRTRLVWTTDLHQRFEEAVLLAGGIEVAVPKAVLEVRPGTEWVPSHAHRSTL